MHPMLLLGSILAALVGVVLALVGLILLVLAIVGGGGADASNATGRSRPGRGRLVGSAFLFLLLGGGLLTAGAAFSMDPIKRRLDKIGNNIFLHSDMYNKIYSTYRIESEREIRELLSQRKYQDPKKLNHFEYRVFSQNGEDGIIAEIFRRIGTTNKQFVEFGASDGTENNTILLLRQGWGGLWIEGSPTSVAVARASYKPEIEAGKLRITEAFITAENIEDLFTQGKVPEEFDLLSIDIDRNDYYVWEKIEHFRPRVAIVEYTSVYPPTMSWVIPYDPKGWWDGTTHTGASLKALEELGNKKGYTLVGCNLNGVNAFFVRKDLVGDHFAGPFTAENHYEPGRLLWMPGTTLPRVP
jgi:hypothetical protein